jgi:hypothetical protein
MLLLVGVSVGVLSPPCGMETKAAFDKSFNCSSDRSFVLSPPCGMET